MSFPERIFLVGMPGSGKSTAGKYLARELRYEFLDLDDLIEDQEGIKIAQIFKEQGEDYFRQLEQDELKRIQGTRLVIATGGGTPCFFDNMEWMNTNGFTIFLNRDLETLIDRTKGKEHRPLLLSNPVESLKKLLEKRLPSYQKAGMESSHTEPCEMLAELRSLFKS